MFMEGAHVFNSHWGVLALAEGRPFFVGTDMHHLDPVVITIARHMGCIMPSLEARQPGFDCLAWDLPFMGTNEADEEDVGGRHVIVFGYAFTITELSKMEEACTIRGCSSRCMGSLDCFEGCLSSISREGVMDFLFKSKGMRGGPASEAVWSSDKRVKRVRYNLATFLRFARDFCSTWGDVRWRGWRRREGARMLGRSW
jgi:hypothetical protein